MSHIHYPFHIAVSLRALLVAKQRKANWRMPEPCHGRARLRNQEVPYAPCLGGFSITKRVSPTKGREQDMAMATFKNYLKAAIDLALTMETDETDDCNLEIIHNVCRNGAIKNWKALTAQGFLEKYLYCIGGIMIHATGLANNWPRIRQLFRQCKPTKIAAEHSAIQAEWEVQKLGLNQRKVNAVLTTAGNMTAMGWHDFKNEYVPKPIKPQSESEVDWLPVFDALNRLPLVGPAIGWFLVRNVYGGPFLKPDTHINAIANWYFGGNLSVMTDEIRKLWPQVCSDTRLKPVHIGEADYFLWNYRKSTNLPKC